MTRPGQGCQILEVMAADTCERALYLLGDKYRLGQLEDEGEEVIRN